MQGISVCWFYILKLYYIHWLLLLLSHFSRVQLCDPIDGSPPGPPVPGILQARTLEWVAISFSNAWKWKVKVKSLSRVRLLATPWTAAHLVSLSFTISWSLLKLRSIESVMPFNHLLLCRPLLLLPSIFPSIRVFSNESALHIRWPKYWSFTLSLSPSNEYSGLISLRMDCLDLVAVPRDSLESSPTP